MKLLVLVGPPCSGKSTWARNFIKDKPEWIRFNRGDFRTMLQGRPHKFDKRFESLVLRMQREAIAKGLEAEYNVVVDNTHCNERDLNYFLINYKGYHEISFKTFILPMETLRDRNIIRCAQDGSFIPVQVLRSMTDNYNILVKDFDFSKYQFNEEAA